MSALSFKIRYTDKIIPSYEIRNVKLSKISNKEAIKKIDFVNLPLIGMGNSFGCFLTESGYTINEDKYVSSDTIRQYSESVTMKTDKGKSRKVCYIDEIVASLEALLNELKDENAKKLTSSMICLLRDTINKKLQNIREKDLKKIWNKTKDLFELRSYMINLLQHLKILRTAAGVVTEKAK